MNDNNFFECVEDPKANPILIGLGIATLVVSIIVGIIVIETSPQSSELLIESTKLLQESKELTSESINLLNNTNTILQRQYEAENFTPFVWVESIEVIVTEDREYSGSLVKDQVTR